MLLNIRDWFFWVEIIQWNIVLRSTHVRCIFLLRIVSRAEWSPWEATIITTTSEMFPSCCMMDPWCWGETRTETRARDTRRSFLMSVQTTPSLASERREQSRYVSIFIKHSVSSPLQTNNCFYLLLINTTLKIKKVESWIVLNYKIYINGDQNYTSAGQ